MPHAQNIDEVLSDLQAILTWSLAQPSRIGYFAALYYGVTADIKSKLGTGFFSNDQLVEQLDVVFANRYLDAVVTYQSGQPLPPAWDVAMTASTNSQLIALQHLLLAMNPHINIDLGVACAEVASSDLPGLHGDFLKVNSILASLVPTIQGELGTVSPWLELLFRIGGTGEDDVVNWSMDAARDYAWVLANVLAPMGETQREAFIAQANLEIASLGRDIIDPGELIGAVVNLVWSRENHDVDTVIRALYPVGLTVV